MIKDIDKLGNTVIKMLEFIEKRKEHKTQKVNEAIMSLVNSLIETKEYMLAIIENPKAKSNSKEMELSRIWYSTAILVREYDSELAKRCSFKGIHWLSRSRFTEQEIIDNKIKLHHIEIDVMKALNSFDS